MAQSNKKVATPRKRPALHKRKYVVNFAFQLAFIKKLFLVAMGITLCQWLALQYVFIKFNLYGEQLPYEQRKHFYDFLAPQVQTLNEAFIYMCIVSAIALIVWGTMQSHRIAGPLFRLRQTIKILMELKSWKDLEHIEMMQFRRNDYFHELAKEFNQALQRLKSLKQETLETEEEESKEIEENNVISLDQYQEQRGKERAREQDKKAS